MVRFSEENIIKINKWCELVGTTYRRFYVEIYDKFVLVKSTNNYDVVNCFYSDKALSQFLSNYDLDF